MTFFSFEGRPQQGLSTRWTSFAGICLLIVFTGTNFAYAIISEVLKTKLGYSTQERDLIASIGSNGAYLSLIAGVLIEKFGFRRVIRGGGILFFVGFFYVYLAVHQWIDSSFSTIAFAYFLSQFGACCHIATAVVLAVKLFPVGAYGDAIGLVKGYFALSSAVIAGIADGLFVKDATGLICFLAFLVPILGKVFN